MIELIEGLPDHVLGLSAAGQVSGDDYQNVVIPVVERKFAQHERIRLLYFMGPDFKKFTTTALWDDARIGLHHLKGIERIAVCTDIGWIRAMATGIGKLMPGQVQVFDATDLSAAKTWIAE